jgi:hypothetical protein
MPRRSEGKSVSTVVAALKAEIARMVKEGVSEAELNRVKAQVLAGQVFSRIPCSIRPCRSANGHGRARLQGAIPATPSSSGDFGDQVKAVAKSI